VAPFGYLVPWAGVRYAAGIITILFQGSIILSGNLSWLNWLTIVIAISCFDDRAISFLIPGPSPGGRGELDALALPHQVAVWALGWW